MSGPSKAALLRFIARNEAFEETLAQFPNVQRRELQTLLEGVAHALEPEAAAAPRAALATPARPEATVRAPGGSTKRVRVYSDGAARGNPGPAGAGAVVTDTDGKIIERVGKFLGRQTNNHAEYMGLIVGLQAALAMGADEVDVFADSQLMIRQLQGRYQMKSASLRPLFLEAKRQLEQFRKVRLAHVPREENGDADEMSNRAIDERM